MFNNIYKKVANIIDGKSNLLLAYSGGIDSTVLLDILTKLKNQYKYLLSTPIKSLKTIHINHNLYKNSWKCIKHCKEQSKKYELSCKIFSVNIKNNSEGIEASARNIRLNIFKKNLLPNESLVLAHHKNDQIETFLLALKRGSGPSGLSAMAEKKKFNKNYILRPLLFLKKNIIEEYAKKNNLCWINDPTNIDLKFDRNFLRCKIIPLLQQRWPHFDKCVVRSAKLCSDQELLLDELLLPILKNNLNIDGSLKIHDLLLMSNIKIKAIIRRWIDSQHIRMPSNLKLDLILKEIIFSKKDAQPKLLIDKKILSRYKNTLFFIKDIFIPNKNIYVLKDTLKLPPNLGKIILTKNRLTKIELDSICKNTYIFLYSKIRKNFLNEKIFIKFAPYNSSFKLKNDNKFYNLKKMWGKLGIPPWLRTNIPLLFYNEKFISAIGLFITNENYIFNKNINDFCYIYWFHKKYNFYIKYLKKII